MADEQNPDSGTPEVQDPVKNLKSEFDRKFGNLEATAQQLADQNRALMSLLQSKAAPAPTQQKASIKELLYKDEDAAAEVIVETAVNRALDKVKSESETAQRYQAKQNQVIAELYKDYPEVGTPGSDLYNKSIEIYNSLPADERSSPLAYKVAVKDAAMELGIAPKSKRPKQNADDFSVGGASSQPRVGGEKKGDLPQEMLQIAQLMGRNVNDPKVLASLKEAAKRTKWGQYKG